MQDLKGKVALVTGGASGLGKAICEVLAEAGVVVTVADVRLDAAQKVAQGIQASDGKAFALQLDVTDEAQATAAIEETVKKCGKLDFLVNNAGIDKTVPVEELSVEDWDRVLAVNLRGPFLMSRLAFPVMREQRRGHIVNIPANAAKRAWANASAYHASKWGLLGLSHGLHVEGREF